MPISPHRRGTSAHCSNHLGRDPKSVFLHSFPMGRGVQFLSPASPAETDPVGPGIPDNGTVPVRTLSTRHAARQAIGRTQGGTSPAHGLTHRRTAHACWPGGTAPAPRTFNFDSQQPTDTNNNRRRKTGVHGRFALSDSANRDALNKNIYT